MLYICASVCLFQIGAKIIFLEKINTNRNSGILCLYPGKSLSVPEVSSLFGAQTSRSISCWGSESEECCCLPVPSSRCVAAPRDESLSLPSPSSSFPEAALPQAHRS